MWLQNKYRPLLAPEGEGGGAGGGGSGTGGAAGGGGAGGTPAWHANIDPTIKSFWEGKKYDISDPSKLVDVVTRNYQHAEKFLGVPADELLRLPKPNAETAEINAFWNKVGVPKEGKDYDFAALKMADGSDLDPAFLDAMRASFHANRVPKDMAPNVIKDVVKYLESNDATELAEKTAYVQQQEQELQRAWGTRYQTNVILAKDALGRLGQAAGISAEDAGKAWDALTTSGGIGAAQAMRMLFTLAQRMGEAPSIFAERRGGSGDTATMTPEDARREIDALKQDKDFGNRLRNKNVEAMRKWTQLHQIMTGISTSAA